MDRPIESETAKIVENSYRASILAFIDEWSLFAERNGVDIIKVIKAIKVRPTHNNILFPGPGIGGYCLPKDGGLGLWAYKHILGWEDDIFTITPLAIDINDTRALHVGHLTRDALRNLHRPIAAAEILGNEGGRAVAAIARQLDDARTTRVERLVCLRALAQTKHPAAAVYIEPHLIDADPLVRAYAAEAYGPTAPASGALLCPALLDEETDPTVRRALTEALDTIKARAANTGGS